MELSSWIPGFHVRNMLPLVNLHWLKSRVPIAFASPECATAYSGASGPLNGQFSLRRATYPHVDDGIPALPYGLPWIAYTYLNS